MTKMEVQEIYLNLSSEDIAYVQAVFESYEGVGIVRTVDPERATIAILVVEQAAEVARAIVESLKKEISLTEIPRPANVGEDWLLRELSTEDSATG